MSSTTRVGFIAGASMLAVSTVSLAGTNAAPEYDQRIADLERQIAELRGEQDAAAEARTAEVRSLVADALADADRRTSMLQSGGASGYDGGFMIANGDGSFSLKMNGQIQARFVANLRDNSGADDTTYGFELRRTKLSFSGNIVDKTWGYKVKGAFSRGGGNAGNFNLEDAYISKKMENGLKVKIGQFKSQFIREENISSGHQLAVDRSLSNELYNQGFGQGIEVDYSQDRFRVAVSVFDGAGTANTSALNQQSEFAMTARVDALVEGDGWDMFKDYSGARGQNYGVRVGGGIHFQRAAFGTAAMNETEIFGFTADAQAEGDGWNAGLAFTYVEGDNNAADGDALFIVAQGGYFFTDDLEGFVRWSYADLDDASGLVTGGVMDVSTITAGVNHYISGKNAKLSLDVVLGLDSIPSAQNGIGLAADAANEDGQLALRGQLQLLF